MEGGEGRGGGKRRSHEWGSEYLLYAREHSASQFMSVWVCSGGEGVGHFIKEPSHNL